MELKVGQKAPEFKLPDQDDKTHTLTEYKGKWLLIYFYPKDNTSGCTKEACMIRDSFPSFGKLDAQVVGISGDSVKSHKKFAEEYKLPFTLLADENKKVMQKYDVWQKKKLYGRQKSSSPSRIPKGAPRGRQETIPSYMGTVRTSFLVDPTGKIAKIYKNVKPELHADEVLHDLELLK